MDRLRIAVRAFEPFADAIARQWAAFAEHTRSLPQLPRWSGVAAVIDELVTEAITTTEPSATLLARAQQELARVLASVGGE